MATLCLPGFKGAAFHHVLNGPEGNAQAQGCLPGTKIFGVRHDQVFFGVSLLKLQIQQILSREQEKLQRKNALHETLLPIFPA